MVRGRGEHKIPIVISVETWTVNTPTGMFQRERKQTGQTVQNNSEVHSNFVIANRLKGRDIICATESVRCLSHKCLSH